MPPLVRYIFSDIYLAYSHSTLSTGMMNLCKGQNTAGVVLSHTVRSREVLCHLFSTVLLGTLRLVTLLYSTLLEARSFRALHSVLWTLWRAVPSLPLLLRPYLPTRLGLVGRTNPQPCA